MIINKKQLQDALEIVKPGLANKELIEQSTSFAFINGRVITYNDEISISHPVEGLELKGAIKATELYAFLTKIKTEEVEFSIKENEIILTSGRAKAGLTLQSEIKLPLDEDVAEQGEWFDLPENFIKYVSFAMTSCSKNMSKPVLTCVHINKNGFIESSDDYRITRCDLKEKLPFTFLLPAASAEVVVRAQPTKIAEGKGFVHFQTEKETIISCRVYEDDFPNVSSVLGMESSTKIVLPRTIEEVLDRAMIFAKRDHLLEETVTVTLEANRLKVQSDSEAGWFEEEISFKYKEEPKSFSITPYLLKGILSETQACELNQEKLKFEGKDWIYITALKEA